MKVAVFNYTFLNTNRNFSIHSDRFIPIFLIRNDVDFQSFEIKSHKDIFHHIYGKIIIKIKCSLY